MKLTLSWLKTHLETSATLAEITNALTKIGLEVEGIEDPALKVKGFGIAYVISAEKHPNADKLRVCMVDDGSGKPVRAKCAGGHEERVLARRHIHPRQGHHAGQGRHSRR
mgnify:CR=1 FL=1